MGRGWLSAGALSVTARHTAAGLVTIVIVLAVGAASATAGQPPSTPISLSGEQVQDALFVAGDTARLDGPGGETSLLEEKVLQDMYTVDPTLEPAQATAAIDQLQRSYLAAYPKSAAAGTGAVRASNGDIATTLSSFNAVEPNVDDGLKEFPAAQTAFAKGLTDVSREAVADADAQVTGGNFDPNLLAEAPPPSFQPQQVLQQTEQQATLNKSFGGARDALWEGTSHENVYENAESLLKDNPALSGNPDLQAAYQELSPSPGNSIQTTVGALNKDFTSDLEDVESTTETAGSQIESLKKGIYSSEATKGLLAEDQTTLGEEEGSLGFDNAITDISEIEPAATVTTEEIGDVAIEDVATVAVDESADLAVTEIDPGMALQLMTQGPQQIMSLVTSLSGVPSPEEVILEQLQVIEKQIKGLSEQVASGLGTVNAELAEVNETLARDTHLLVETSVNVEAIRNDMGQLQDQLDAIQADLFEIASTQRNETLENDVATAIGYSTRAPGGAPMSVDQFEQSAGTFYDWGDTFPFDAISELPELAWTSNPDQVFAQLETPTDEHDLGAHEPGYPYALDANLDFLAAHAAKEGWSEPVAGALPNPDVWAAGANAFAQLLFENPAYVTPPLLSELGQITSVGASLWTGLTTLTGPGTPGTTQSAPQQVDGLSFDTGSSVVNHALANYLEVGVTNPDSLVHQVETEETDWLAAHQQSSDANCQACELATEAGARNIDLWGSPEQAPSPALTPLQTTAAPDATNHAGQRGAIEECSGAQSLASTQVALDPEVPTDTLTFHDVPNPLLDPLPNVYANAWHLGLGHLVACYSASWASWSYSPPEAPRASLNATVQWQYNGLPVFEVTITTPEQSVCGPSFVGSNEAAVELREDWTLADAQKYCVYGGLSGEGYSIEPIIAQLVANVMKLTPPARGVPLPIDVPAGATVCQAPLGASFCAYDYSALTPVQTAVSGGLTKLQAEIYGAIDSPGGGALTSTNGVAEAAVKLDGARALIGDYLQLGLPSSLGQDPVLRALIDGPAHLLDDNPLDYGTYGSSDNDVYNYFQRAIAHPPTSDPAAPGGGLEATIKQDSSELSGAIAKDVGESQKAGPATDVGRAPKVVTATDVGESPEGETDPLIATTLARLSLIHKVLESSSSESSEPQGGSQGGAGSQEGEGSQGGSPQAAAPTESPAPPTGAVHLSPQPPSCMLTPAGSKVTITAAKRGGHSATTGTSSQPGALTFAVRCDQRVSFSVSGTVTGARGGAHKKKRRLSVFTIAAVHGSVNADATITMVVRLGSFALAALERGLGEAVTVRLTAANANGTGVATATIRRLVPRG
jgi:hypothetical protein